MSRINYSRALAVLLGAFVLAMGVARGQNAESSGKPAWSVELRKELIEHDPPFYRAYITAGTNKFALLLPQGYFARGKEEGVLRLANTDGSSQITFAVRPAADSRYADMNSVREFLLAGHPGAKVTADFAVSVLRWTGHGFDLNWKSSSGNAQSGRTVVVPIENGALEFTATTTPENFSAVQTSLDRFMRSLLVAKDGKLTVPQISGKL